MAEMKQQRMGLFPRQSAGAASNTFNNHSLDATNDAAYWVFYAQEGETITHLGFRMNSTTSAPTYRISLQGVNGADSTYDGSVKASATFDPATLTAGEFNWIAVGTPYAVTSPEALSIVIEYSSGTIGGSNFMSVTATCDFFGARTGIPRCGLVTGGVHAQQANVPVWGYKTASIVRGLPLKAITLTSFSSNSTPDEYGLAFTLPAGAGATKKILGFHAIMSSPASAKTLLCSLYSNTSSLDSVTIDGDLYYGASSGARAGEIKFTKSSLDAINFGSEYIVAVKAQETSSNWAVATMDFSNAADLDALPGGTSCYLVTRADSDAWTTVTTSRPMIDPIIDDWTEPSGGGGTVGKALFDGALVHR